ncbi:alpha-ketoacid dehydrogenase subunit alpha/beta [Phaeocystidibacter marisrubri]|uniref:Dehydrogenase n=1 Tax=Phaeocystidibacter marisrubri TaxID=1577780 RepID=A0A6L3ZJC0_9FLAO|nr:dehydrogenase E1 component subunit alpha/beta [Phaeocystidibacter marisrubri]KAB2818034.1 dehydrogenase [Phaeocystidibacter marisrubri]GGH72284.1 dehydrogenase [Phaeocystidibacter marisrubri]
MKSEAAGLPEQPSLTNEQYIDLYKAMIIPRLIEDKMLILLRQGRISKWFSGYGQEAVSVGTSLAMNEDEFICTMHRNLGVFTSRKVPLNKLFAQFQGKLEGFTKGRDRSFHFGSKEHKIVGMISHLGPQLGLADGLALGHLIDGDQKVAMVYTGDGGASEGDFHEALNVASVWGLPVIFVIENNQWGLSTPSREQFNFDSFTVKGPAYGMEAYSVDGNDIIEVYRTTRALTDSMRSNPRPVILECKTFRIRGHEEASGTKYYPEGLIEEWTTKDPLKRFEAFLIENNITNEKEMQSMQAEVKKHIADELDVADSYPVIQFDEEREFRDLFAPFDNEEVHPSSDKVEELRMIDAIHSGLTQAMEAHPELVLMGQDIADYGGVFKATDGLMQKFGKARVRNTPLCEAAILGTGLGLSIVGKKSMVEMQFADFVTEGFTQIVNNLAKIHWRWGQNADVVVRMPTGAGVAAGPFHSQSNEAWFTHTPGLKVVYPSNPADAKGLLLQAFRDPNPVMFFEHKGLYRSETGEVPTEYYTVPFGRASIVKAGSAATLVTYGMGVHKSMDIVRELDADVEVIDLRTLVPWDYETIATSVRKTGRLILVSEDVRSGGFINDISARVGEELFTHLDAPIVHVTSLDTPIPFASPLEGGFLPWNRLKEKLEMLLEY